MNFVADDLLLTIQAYCAHLHCGFPRLKRSGAREETQALQGRCSRFNSYGIEQLPAQHLIAAAYSHDENAGIVATMDVVLEPRRSQINKIGHGALRTR